MILGISGKIGSGKDTVGAIIRFLTQKEPSISFKESMDIFETTRMLSVEPGLESSWEIKKFAGKLKQIVALLTGCSVSDLEDQEFKMKPLGKEWDWVHKYVNNVSTKGPVPQGMEDRAKNYTYREMLQKVGTEAMRDIIHENVWVNALFADYFRQNKWKTSSDITVRSTYHPEMDAGHEDIYPFPNWIITDMRFPNEMAAVKERNGITIRVDRYLTKKTFSEDGLVSMQGVMLDFNAHPSETALDSAEFDYVIENDGTIEELVEKVKEILIKENII